MRTVAVIQARMSSTRLSGKVLLPFGQGTVLEQVVHRVRKTPGLDAVCVAIPMGEEHNSVADEARRIGNLLITRGSEDDVLDRYRQAARESDADLVLRVTSDCPLIDPAVCGAVLDAGRHSGNYARTSFATGYPLGLDCEAIPRTCLDQAWADAKAPDEREHVTPYIWRRPDLFPQIHITRHPCRREWRLTLDEPSDYEALTEIDRALPAGTLDVGFDALETLLVGRPDLLSINASVQNKHVTGSPGAS